MLKLDLGSYEMRFMTTTVYDDEQPALLADLAGQMMAGFSCTGKLSDIERFAFSLGGYHWERGGYGNWLIIEPESGLVIGHALNKSELSKQVWVRVDKFFV